MRRYLQKHKTSISLFLALLISLAWISAQTGSGSGQGLFKRSIVAVASVPERGALAATDALERFWDGYIDLADKSLQNRLLLDEIRRRDAELNRYREIAAENARLRKILDIRATLPVSALTARVVGRNPSNWFSTLTINMGSDDGVIKDMAVLSSDGVIGRVVTVNPGSSRVLLLTDPSSAIAVMVQRSRENCILKGQVGRTSEIRYLPQESDVAAGDVLVTSGLEGIFPKGLEVARIVHVEYSANKYFLAAQAAPVADLGRIEEVLLVPGDKGK